MSDKISEVRFPKHHARGQIPYSQKASVELWRQQMRRGADRGAERAS